MVETIFLTTLTKQTRALLSFIIWKGYLLYTKENVAFYTTQNVA